MKEVKDSIQNKVSRRDVMSCTDALLETLLAAFPMEGDRQEAERSWQQFVAEEENKR